jgi:transcriptional regulator GlxA family with amidase domain
MDQRIALALRMISQDVRSAPAPRAVAGMMGLSLSHFYDLFRKETGTVPATYIRSLRYEKARELLVNSQLSIKEITHLVGFNDVSHFVRDFQKIYGASPAKFRRLCSCAPTKQREFVFPQDWKIRQ